MIRGVKMKKKKTTAGELPEEVVQREILARLPIKSVVRFKSVSKSWLSLFSSPQFVKQHHTHNSTQNPNDDDCLVADKRNRIVILSRYKETILFPSDRFYLLIGSINGLVCLRRRINLSLWNPAIHQSKEFTIPPPCFRSNEDYIGVGLGFDPVTNEFKVVALSVDLRSASVYSSGLDSWSDVLIPDNVFGKNGYEKAAPVVIVKGCPYWTCKRYTDERRREYSLSAVKFNAQTNDFNLSPEFHFDATIHRGSYLFHYRFVDIKDRLNLILRHQNSSYSVLDIYSLDGEEEGCCVWSKLYTIEPLNVRMQFGYVSQGFRYGREIVFYDAGIFSCYDHETDTIKRLLGTNSTPYAISCFTYQPTLFFIQGMKSVHLTTQARTPGCYRIPRRLISSLRD